MSTSYLFTSESVSEGHPDKIADQISDAVLDAILAQDKRARVACETMVKTGAAIVAGEVTTSAWVDIEALARKVINDSRNLYLSDVGAATHYHAVYVKPRWARSMKKMQKIGRHIFYKTYGGGWS